jgi:hypothetical protein
MKILEFTNWLFHLTWPLLLRKNYAIFGMLHHVALVRTDFSLEHVASIIRVTRTGKQGTVLAVTRNQIMLPRNTM